MKPQTRQSMVWVTTSQAADELGCSQRFLRDNRDTLFKRGVHYRILNPQAWRPSYRWNLERLGEFMSQGLRLDE